MASLLDIGQTFLELTGCPACQGMQGHSLCPILKDLSASVREQVLVEEGMLVDVTNQGSAYCLRTLVTEKARLTLYEGIEHGKLFDWKNDPDEMNNLFAKPEGRQLRTEMMAYSHYGKAPEV